MKKKMKKGGGKKKRKRKSTFIKNTAEATDNADRRYLVLAPGNTCNHASATDPDIFGFSKINRNTS